MSTRQQIIDSMARTLFVLAWMEHEEDHGRSIPAQADWFDYAPRRTPARARYKARDLALRIEKMSGATLDRIYAHAARAPGRHYRRPTVSDFGYALAMQAVGHGVSWFDDHPNIPHFTMKLPHIGFGASDLWSR